MSYGNLIVMIWHKVRVIFTKLVSGATRAVILLRQPSSSGLFCREAVPKSVNQQDNLGLTSMGIAIQTVPEPNARWYCLGAGLFAVIVASKRKSAHGPLI